MSGSGTSRHLKGKPASAGIGMGPARILEERKQLIHREKISDHEVDDQISRFNRGVDLLKAEFEELRDQAEEPEVAEIIEAQIQTLIDPELQKTVEKKVRTDHLSVLYAIYSTFNDYISLLEMAQAEWAGERTIDIESIRDQLIDITQQNRSAIEVSEGDLVFASEIPPTVMIELSRTNIAGIVIQKGGLTSHAVILSQSLGIPCVVGLKWRQSGVQNGLQAIIDGSDGTVILKPTPSEKSRYEQVRTDQIARLAKEAEAAEAPHETRCGKPYSLRANVEFLEELPRIQARGARGVGLLRTETILFGKRGFHVNDQIEFYSEVLKASGSNRVTIRLFDAGGDKMLENSDEEANPFLGWRGIRMLLDEKELLENQVESILRTAAIYPGRISLLVPMITGPEEIDDVKALVESVQKRLKAEGVDPGHIPFGIMIEVPGTAVMADFLSKEVDFFSIGTNDLTQYTLAADRGNEKIAGLFDPAHPAVWRLIRMTVEGAAKGGIPVSVCGEMASSPAAAAALFGLGIRDLSMTTNAIPAVHELLSGRTAAEMENLAKNVLEAGRASEVHRILDRFSSGEQKQSD